MATVLTLTANTLLDLHVETALTLRSVNRVQSIVPVAGGKGLNVARVLARHGHRVIASGFCGGLTGRMLSELTAADGIEPAFVPTAARTRIGLIAVHPPGGTTAILEDGFAVAQDEIGALIQILRSRLAGVDLLIVGGSVPDPSCNGLYRMVLDLCVQGGVPCWIDSYGSAMDEALAHSNPPVLVKPNRQEYGRGRKWLTATEMHLTDGGQEIRVRHPEGRYRVIPPQVAEINAVGSGDCYLAALAHARLSGDSLVDQLRYAAAAGAANAARSDIARITPSDIRALLDQVDIRPIAD